MHQALSPPLAALSVARWIRREIRSAVSHNRYLSARRPPMAMNGLVARPVTFHIVAGP